MRIAHVGSAKSGLEANLSSGWRERRAFVPRILSLRSWVESERNFGRDTFYVLIISPTFAQREIAHYPFLTTAEPEQTGLVPRLHRIHPPESRLSPGKPSYSSHPLSLVAVRGLPSVSRTTGGSIGGNQRRQWAPALAE
jgi:hypothetical protein